MKTIEYVMLDNINFCKHIYSPVNVFVTVLDSFIGHFDGKEYWTIRREKQYNSFLNNEVTELIETKTVCAEEFLESIKRDEENIHFAESNNFQKV